MLTQRQNCTAFVQCVAVRVSKDLLIALDPMCNASKSGCNAHLSEKTIC